MRGPPPIPRRLGRRAEPAGCGGPGPGSLTGKLPRRRADLRARSRSTTPACPARGAAILAAPRTLPAPLSPPCPAPRAEARRGPAAPTPAEGRRGDGLNGRGGPRRAAAGLGAGREGLTGVGCRVGARGGHLGAGCGGKAREGVTPAERGCVWDREGRCG